MFEDNFVLNTSEKTDNCECLINGICTTNPTLASIQEVIILYLRELSFYLLKLKDFGITNETIKHEVLDVIFCIISNIEYNQQNFEKIISKLDGYIKESRFLYEKECNKKDIPIEKTKLYFKNLKSYKLSDAIKRGEKYFLKKMENLSPQQKGLYDIAIVLGKNMALKLIEIHKLGDSFDEAYYGVLSLLNSLNTQSFSVEKMKNFILNIMDIYYSLFIKVYEVQAKNYGKREETEVSFSSHYGKCILASGLDLKSFEQVLQQAQKNNINVYTHGIKLLMSHCFPKIKTFKNLKGHFGTGIENSAIDFSIFPGSVIMTKDAFSHIEQIFKGRIFTTDSMAPLGIKKIKTLEPLIDSALWAKGFSNPKQKNSIVVGYNEKKVVESVDKIIEKTINGSFKQIYFVGLLNFFDKPNKYFEDFFKYLPKNSFVFSLAYNLKGNNIFHLDNFFDYSLFYKIVQRFQDKKPINELNMNVFITKADNFLLSNLIYLKKLGFKNVFKCKTSPKIITPIVNQTLLNYFDIKEMTDAQSDIKLTLK